MKREVKSILRWFTPGTEVKVAPVTGGKFTRTKVVASTSDSLTLADGRTVSNLCNFRGGIEYVQGDTPQGTIVMCVYLPKE